MIVFSCIVPGENSEAVLGTIPMCVGMLEVMRTLPEELDSTLLTVAVKLNIKRELSAGIPQVSRVFA